MINKKFVKRGFTLLETLVAILILTMAVSAPIYIAGKSLQDARIAKDEITAYYLAQDAVEYIRFDRDSACLAASPTGSCPTSAWLSGNPPQVPSLAPCISLNGSATCTIDSFNNKVASCGGTCAPMNYDAQDNGGYYTYGSGSPSIFTRTISIVSPSATIPTVDEGFLTVVVKWNDGGTVTHSVQVKEDLFNWQ